MCEGFIPNSAPLATNRLSKEIKVEKPDIKESVGKSLLDIAKLTFASFILGGILRGSLPQYILILIGVIVSAACFVFGILWTSKKPEKRHKE